MALIFSRKTLDLRCSCVQDEIWKWRGDESVTEDVNEDESLQSGDEWRSYSPIGSPSARSPVRPASSPGIRSPGSSHSGSPRINKIGSIRGFGTLYPGSSSPSWRLGHNGGSIVDEVMSDSSSEDEVYNIGPYPYSRGSTNMGEVNDEPERSSSVAESYTSRPPSPPPLFDFRSSSLHHPPKTGTNRVLIHPNPHPLVESVLPGPQPILAHSSEAVTKLKEEDVFRRNRAEAPRQRLVYDCMAAAEAIHTTSKDGTPCTTLPPYYVPSDEEDRTLIFESRFESGNLRRAIQIGPLEYDMHIKTDFNTRSHTQWFYFSISNVKAHHAYKFNIVNMMKPASQFNEGMQPVVYSTRKSQEGAGWRRGGQDIGYFQNNLRRPDSRGCLYTLTFSLVPEFDNDTLYVAYCFPYTFTDLQEYLKVAEAKTDNRSRMRRRILCQTLAGNSCDLLTITSFMGDPEVLKRRKGIVITARVHPGETNASWMMKGMLDFLLGDTPEAIRLRDAFVFRIVPMLNPDGVINGNYRCGLAGQDLNRQWGNPSRKINPTIYYTKLMMTRFAQDREIVLYTDLHGHSRKKNIFMYGCEGSRQRLEERVFPQLLSRRNDMFTFSDCSFKVQKARTSCGRIVVWKELNVVSSYTMEASFCGPSGGRYANMHFHTSHLEEVGQSFCECALEAFGKKHDATFNSTMLELKDLYKNQEAGAADSEGDTSSSDGNEGVATRAAQMASGVKVKAARKKVQAKNQIRSSSRNATARPSQVEKPPSRTGTGTELGVGARRRRASSIVEKSAGATVRSVVASTRAASSCAPSSKRPQPVMNMNLKDHELKRGSRVAVHVQASKRSLSSRNIALSDALQGPGKAQQSTKSVKAPTMTVVMPKFLGSTRMSDNARKPAGAATRHITKTQVHIPRTVRKRTTE